jgi:hypothetical protein
MRATGPLRPLWALLFLLLPLCVACPGPVDDDGGVTDAGAVDAGGDADGGYDAGDLADGGYDAGVPGPLAGFGVIDGCPSIDAELTAATPALVANAIDFATNGWDDTEVAELSAGGQEIWNGPNAGGSSKESEVFAYEVLYRCEGATLLKTENEVSYDDAGPITDLLVDIDGEKIGVSVTRAIAFPFEDPYTVAQAQTLLEDKLQGVLDSTALVAAEDRWRKQILHVIAYAPGHKDSLEQAFATIDAALKSDTIVYVTVSDGDDAFLY